MPVGRADYSAVRSGSRQASKKVKRPPVRAGSRSNLTTPAQPRNNLWTIMEDDAWSVHYAYSVLYTAEERQRCKERRATRSAGR